jgi:hypothetical protein
MIPEQGHQLSIPSGRRVRRLPLRGSQPKRGKNCGARKCDHVARSFSKGGTRKRKHGDIAGRKAGYSRNEIERPPVRDSATRRPPGGKLVKK